MRTRLFISASLTVLLLTVVLSNDRVSAEPGTASTRATSRATTQTTKPVAIPALNRALLAFAQKNLGKKVADGDCWQFVDRAFKSVGVGRPDISVWGRALGPDEPWLPGDCVQFDSVRLEKHGRWITLGGPGHSAIVLESPAPGVMTVLHQNYEGKFVTKNTFDMNTKTAGSFIVYRPGPQPKKRK